MTTLYPQKEQKEVYIVYDEDEEEDEAEVTFGLTSIPATEDTPLVVSLPDFENYVVFESDQDIPESRLIRLKGVLPFPSCVRLKIELGAIPPVERTFDMKKNGAFVGIAYLNEKFLFEQRNDPKFTYGRYIKENLKQREEMSKAAKEGTEYVAQPLKQVYQEHKEEENEVLARAMDKSNVMEEESDDEEETEQSVEKIEPKELAAYKEKVGKTVIRVKEPSKPVEQDTKVEESPKADSDDLVKVEKSVEEKVVKEPIQKDSKPATEEKKSSKTKVVGKKKPLFDIDFGNLYYVCLADNPKLFLTCDPSNGKVVVLEKLPDKTERRSQVWELSSAGYFKNYASEGKKVLEVRNSKINCAPVEKPDPESDDILNQSWSVVFCSAKNKTRAKYICMLTNIKLILDVGKDGQGCCLRVNKYRKDKKQKWLFLPV